MGEQCLGPDDYQRVEEVYDTASDILSTVEEACGLKCDVASILIPGGAIAKASKVAKSETIRQLGQFTIKTKIVPGHGPGQSRRGCPDRC